MTKLSSRLKVLREGLQNWSAAHHKGHGERRQKAASAASTALLVLAVALCLFVIASVQTRGYVSIAGRSLFRVVTGSMEPTIPTGALLVSRETPMEELMPGDIVCYRSRQEQSRGLVITHRVIAIVEDESGRVLLETRGDANSAADSRLVAEEDLIGKVVWYTGRRNVLSAVIGVLSSGVGFLSLVAVPALLIAGLILLHSVRQVHEELEQLNQALSREKERKQRAITSGLSPEEYEQLRQEVLRELMAEREELMRQVREALRRELQQGEQHERPDESVPSDGRETRT